MTHPPLFFYGTLRDPDILMATLGRTPPDVELIAAQAHDYAAVYFPGRVYPALVPRPGGTAVGLLLKNATETDRAALDAFEGDEYRRGPLLVTIGRASIGAEAYFPAVEISPAAENWTLEQWTLRHKPMVIGDEMAAALAVRRRLSRRLDP